MLELVSGQAAHVGEIEPMFHKVYVLPSETKESIAMVVL